MRGQQNIAGVCPQEAWGIVVPLALPGLRVVRQRRSAVGELEVTVIGTLTRATCPRGGRVSAQVQDVRSRRKQDVALGACPVARVLRKRRFRCLGCQRAFTEPDAAGGWRRRTTVRLREQLGEQACTHPVAQVAAAHGVGPRLVRAGLEEVAEQRLREDGRTLDEAAPLPTPRFLGIDEFARRKGRRDDPDELRQALSAFRTWREEILAFFHFLPLRLTNGFVEGKNTRTQALMRQAYGYRNRRTLRLRLLTEVA